MKFILLLYWFLVIVFCGTILQNMYWCITKRRWKVTFFSFDCQVCDLTEARVARNEKYVQISVKWKVFASSSGCNFNTRAGNLPVASSHNVLYHYNVREVTFHSIRLAGNRFSRTTWWKFHFLLLCFAYK